MGLVNYERGLKDKKEIYQDKSSDWFLKKTVVYILKGNCQFDVFDSYLRH